MSENLSEIPGNKIYRVISLNPPTDAVAYMFSNTS